MHNSGRWLSVHLYAIPSCAQLTETFSFTVDATFLQTLSRRSPPEASKKIPRGPDVSLVSVPRNDPRKKQFHEQELLRRNELRTRGGQRLRDCLESFTAIAVHLGCLFARCYSVREKIIPTNAEESSRQCSNGSVFDREANNRGQTGVKLLVRLCKFSRLSPCGINDRSKFPFPMDLPNKFVRYFCTSYRETMFFRVPANRVPDPSPVSSNYKTAVSRDSRRSRRSILSVNSESNRRNLRSRTRIAHDADIIEKQLTFP